MSRLPCFASDAGWEKISMTSYEFLLTDSLEKVLPDRRPEAVSPGTPRLLKNQRWSFQLAYTCRNDDFGETPTTFRLRRGGDAGEVLQLFRAELVPCNYPCHGTWDDNYLTTRPGLLPDLLRPAGWEESFKAVPAQWRSLWMTLDAALLPPGRSEISLEVLGENGEALAAFSFAVQVLEEALPPQTLLQTQWFHADCLADYYHVPVFSEEHWHILDNFIRSAADHGVNMLLTPVFTPPLDTAKGGERTTVQLVDVFFDGETWNFGFGRLRRWVELARRHGITEIEVAHLFTQWGAELPLRSLCRRLPDWKNGSAGTPRRWAANIPVFCARSCPRSRPSWTGWWVWTMCGSISRTNRTTTKRKPMPRPKPRWPTCWKDAM